MVMLFERFRCQPGCDRNRAAQASACDEVFAKRSVSQDEPISQQIKREGKIKALAPKRA
jgi:hypothetical protein